jgi:hypothetical protein
MGHKLDHWLPVPSLNVPLCSGHHHSTASKPMLNSAQEGLLVLRLISRRMGCSQQESAERWVLGTSRARAEVGYLIASSWKISYSVHDVGHTSAQTLLIQARDKLLPNEEKKLSIPPGIARQARTTNLYPSVRLLGPVKVHLCLSMAANHTHVVQTSTKIVRASECGR